KRNVAFVYQQFINYPNFTVFDNIASPLRVLGQSRHDIDVAVNRVAELLKLSPMLKRMPDELSGGQQQRTALARALVKQAELVLLDEPLANLDYKLREELRDELPPLFADLGTTVVYATSEPVEALLLGGYTATLHEGRVFQFGETAGLYHEPASLTSARVFSDPPINTIEVRKQGGQMLFGNNASWDMQGQLLLLPDGEYTLAVRPHHLNLEPIGDDTLAIKGKVVVTEISGSESVVHAGVEGQVWVSQNHGIHPMQIGAEADFYIQTDRCLIFDKHGLLVKSWQK
ncbi:MAG: ABC transporter ATP-binding protein, partial [Gammaproteobacteria bacterium]|nr:ABC transporter ATP-binding protein [Gammaproteobacteria bacterium]